MDSNQILLVLGILEGRHFPSRPKHRLLIEAKLEKEILFTDPVLHEDAPRFSTELAWELDLKTFRQHRLQRSPIKLQVYSIDNNSSSKEPVGYCIIDLRTAQEKPANEKWYPLLSCKYPGKKPQIKVALSVESESDKENEPPVKATPLKPIKEKLEAVLDEEQGYYMIGSPTSNCHVFVLSVMIGAAKDLSKLIPSHISLKPEEGYYFYYSLFDNDVTNETFYDLINTTFPPERATVRIRSTATNLHKYFTEKQTLDIHLCSGGESLGYATISLKGLVLDETKLLQEPSIVEGLFPLKSNKDISDSTSATAYVGLSVVLKREHLDENEMLGGRSSPMLAGGGMPPKTVPEAEVSEFDGVLAESPGGKKEGKGIDKQSCSTPQKKEIRTKIKDSDRTRSPKGKSNVIEKMETITSDEGVNHHISFSIDLRSVSQLEISNPVNLVCRYSYQFFGSTAPVITNPPVLIQRNMEALLPQSFCVFEFASSLQLLHSTLIRVPLIVEVWHRDNNMKNGLIGICQVQLSHVFDAQKTQAGPAIERQVISEKLPIYSAESPTKKVGSLQVVLCYEDHGETRSQVEPLKTSQRVQNGDLSESVTMDTISSSDQQQGEKGDVRAMKEYEVAMELEMWRNEQQELFQAQLSTKEAEHMKVLATEWKRRDAERENLIQRKVKEYESLQAKLKSALLDLEQREQAVVEREMELKSIHLKMNEEHETKLNALRESSRLLKTEHDERLRLMQMKVDELQNSIVGFQEQIKYYENALRQRDSDFRNLQDAQKGGAEAKMQSEINLLKLEKTELERKLDAIMKSKVHYKQQWGRALRELACIKKNEHEAAKAHLRKQEHELEHMKLRYLAAEEKEVMQEDKNELQNLRESLLKLQEKKTSEIPNGDSGAISEKRERDVNSVDEPRDEHIARLISERDTLLQTGVYSHDDKVIAELDRQIRAGFTDVR